MIIFFIFLALFPFIVLIAGAFASGKQTARLEARKEWKKHCRNFELAMKENRQLESFADEFSDILASLTK